MSVSIQLAAIAPKKGTNPDIEHVRRILRQAGFELVGRMTYYPQQKQHVKYRRTGSYGRSWTTIGPVMAGDSMTLTVANKMPYARFVGGFKTRQPRQVWWAGAYGWRSIETEFNPIWRRTIPLIRKALRRQS